MLIIERPAGRITANVKRLVGYITVMLSDTFLVIASVANEAKC